MQTRLMLTTMFLLLLQVDCASTSNHDSGDTEVACDNQNGSPHNQSSKYTFSLRDSSLGGKVHPLTNDLLHTHLYQKVILFHEGGFCTLHQTGPEFCFSCKLLS